jgi:flagellar motor switch protein FliM
VSDLLSNDEIAKLFDKAASGVTPEATKAGSGGPSKRTRGLRTIDFQHPRKFTAEHERALKRAVDQFCRTANRRLSTELRMDVELEVIDVSQLTWFNAHAQIPPEAICAPISADVAGESSQRMLLTAEQSLMLTFIERVLGGTQPSRERKLTDIDLVVAKRFFSAITDELSVVWNEMANSGLTLQRLLSQPEAGNLTSASDPTLAIVMEGRLNRQSSTVMLLIPYQVAETMLGEMAAGDPTDPRTARAVDAALRRVSVPVRAEVASMHLSLEDVLSLRPGDVLRFDVPVADGVRIMTDDIEVHAAVPGRAGRRRAVQIVPTPEDPGTTRAPSYPNTKN